VYIVFPIFDFMFRYQKNFILIAFFMLFISCNKDKVIPPNNGIYRGVFSRILFGGDTSGTGVLHLVIDEASNGFIMTGDTSSNVPVSCSGDYILLSDDEIQFINRAPVPTLDDPFFILDTVYTYVFSDSLFDLELSNDGVRYVYNLRRF